MRHASLTLILTLCCSLYSAGQRDKISNKADEAIDQRDTSGLSDSKIDSGLREALRISTAKAVAVTGRPDGFLKNEAIKIVLPPKLEMAGKELRMVGMGKEFDELEVGMNRAAEQAAPQAGPIFRSALHNMTFSDVRHILTGGNTAATDYFKRACSADLTTAFTPVVRKSMNQVGVAQLYERALKKVPGGNLIEEKFDLDGYIVAKSLDGIFYMLAQEETQIRKNPVHQTTVLLKEVFGRK